MVEEKIRSVFKLGKSTLVMSLPKSWTESISLKKGDKLIVRIEKDGTLSLLPRNIEGKGLGEVEVPVDAAKLSEEDLEKKIIAKYVDGYSLIKVKAYNGLFTPHHHDTIRKSVNKLFGLHVMELTTEEVIIQSLLDPSELPIRKGLERTHALTLSMYDGALKALMASDAPMAKSILRMRIDLARFHYLVLRQLRSSLLRSSILRRLKIDPIDCLDYLTAIQIIIRVAKCAEQILKDVVALRDFRLPNDILSLINSFGEKALDVYERSVNAFLNCNVSDGFEAIGAVQSAINAEALKLNKKLAEAREEGVPCEVMCHVIQIVDCVKRIADQGIELAETTIYRSKQ